MKPRLKQFLSHQKFVFVPAFFALSLLSEWFRHQNTELHGFPGEIISSATLQNVDVNERISLFYKALILLLFLFLFFRFLTGYIEQKLKNKWLLKTLNGLSFIGLTLLFFQLFYSSIGYSINLVLVLMFWAIPFYFIDSEQKQKTSEFLWLSTLSFSLAFLFRFILLKAGWLWLLNHFEIIFSFTFAILLLIYSLFSKQQELLIKIVSASAPLFFIPIIFFLSDEIYLILNQHEIFFLSPSTFRLIFVVVLLMIGVLTFRRPLNQFDFKHFLTRFVYPITLIGYVIFTYYSPFWEQTADMFETANSANAVMRWFIFGEIPILEAQSSHLFADYLFKFLYTFFNGFDGSLGFYNYKFIHKLILYIAAYYFLGKILNNYLFSFVFLMFFPYVGITFGSLAIALLTPLMFYRLYQNYSFKTLILYLLLLFFLLFWRPDIGVANLSGGVVLLLLYYLAFGTRKKIIDFFKAILFIGLVVLIPVIIIVFIKEIDLWANINKSLEYFGGNQAHGFAKIAKSVDRYYLIHYFVFPTISLVIFLYFGSKALKSKKAVSFFILSIIFLTTFYFIYAQRGLVRHSLFEGSDTFISSLVYLLFALVIVNLFKHKRVWVVFPLALILLIVSFKYPDSFGRNNLIEKGLVVFNQKPLLLPQSEKISRVNQLPKKERDLLYADFKRFFDSNFDSNSTFLDFSNTPTLYFYTGRQIPSYFNQYMQNTITSYLQEENIKTLNKLDVPIVVFSHNPLNWFDNTDLVLNTLRYNKISSYIYQNYIPLGTVGNYYLWIKKGISMPRETETIDFDSDFAYSVVKQDLKKLPHLPGFKKWGKQSLIYEWDNKEWQKNRIVLKLDSVIHGDQISLKISINNHSGNNIPLYIKYKTGNTEYFALKFTLFANENSEYIVPLSWIYAWYVQKGNRLILYSKGASELDVKHISIIKTTD